MKLNVLEKQNKERVYSEYNMRKEGIAQDVLAIKNWLLKQPHLPRIKGELLSVDVDEWLENYLISCKNSVERVKECLDMYFTSKAIVPEVFTGRDPCHPAFYLSSTVMGIAIVPKVTSEGRRVMIFSHLKDSAEGFEPVVMMKRTSMILDVLLQEGIDFTGLEVIVDSKNFCFSQLTRYNVAVTKRAGDIGFKALPQRVHRIHVVNPTSIVETGLTFFKPLLPKKLQDRFVVHRELKNLHESIPQNVLPSDFGGEAPSLAELNDAWHEKLILYRDWFLSHDRHVRSDESKRIGKCRYELNETTFGSQGSFRKIEVD